jgi:hypothetical protein
MKSLDNYYDILKTNVETENNKELYLTRLSTNAKIS